jgi:hypothetical protein
LALRGKLGAIYVCLRLFVLFCFLANKLIHLLISALFKSGLGATLNRDAAARLAACAPEFLSGLNQWHRNQA